MKTLIISIFLISLVICQVPEAPSKKTAPEAPPKKNSAPISTKANEDSQFVEQFKIWQTIQNRADYQYTVDLVSAFENLNKSSKNLVKLMTEAFTIAKNDSCQAYKSMRNNY